MRVCCLAFPGRLNPSRSVGGLLTKALRGAEEVIERIAENWNIETLDDAGETSAGTIPV
jgi:hypothetical protein